MARPKGSKNRSTLKFIKALEELDFHIPDELVTLYRDTPDVTLKLKILDVLAKYAHSKPDPEPTPIEKPEDESENLSTSQLLEIAKK